MEQETSNLPDRNSTVKNIFATMNYGEIVDNISSAEAWLKDLQPILSSDENVLHGRSFNIIGSTGSVILQIVHPSSEDVKEIIAAPKTDWTNSNKALLLYKLSNEIEKNSGLICQLEVLVRRISGKYTMSALPLLIDVLRYYSGHAATDQEKVDGALLSIVDDDTFLSAFGYILGPALAVGCDIILQTGSYITVLAILIKQLTEKVGFPKNCIRILPGEVCLDDLLLNEKIGIISCFGNLYGNKFKDVNCPILKPLIAVSNIKGPMIVFNNADLESASNAVIDAAWGYGSVLPWSLNTVIVQEDVFDIFISKLKNHLLKVRADAKGDKLGDISRLRDCDHSKIKKVVNEAKLLGLEVIQSTSEDSLFHATVILGGDVLKNVSLENSNLPIVTVTAFRNTTEAISMSNNFKYKMGVSVWTENNGLANEVAQKLQFSNVWINSYSKFSGSHSVWLDKNSGMGYIGGLDGACEYYKSTPQPEQIAFKIHTTPFTYNNMFNIDGIYGKHVGKEVSSAVAASKKGYEVWHKLTIYDRFQMLIKLSLQIESSKEFIIKKTGVSCLFLDYWIRATYKSFTQFVNIGNVDCKGLDEIKTFREPVGIIVIEESKCIFNHLDYVIGSLMLGNSVIILNIDKKLIHFYAEICQLLAVAKFPLGVLNVILNVEDNTFDGLVSYDEISTFIYFNKRPSLTINRIKRLYNGSNLSSLLSYVTKTKHVWSNIGGAVL